MYDYLIVGAGLYGCVCARELTDRGKKCLVIDRRDHIAGNAYTRNSDGIQVHHYGAHIFHTADREVWDYVNRFARFYDYEHTVDAVYQGKRYSLPFNMHTFRQMWGVTEAEEAREKIRQQTKALQITQPRNLEEQALLLVGRDIYTALIKGYTEKQWGRDCRELPAFIIRRLPCRFTYDNRYFSDPYQGIPVEGYTAMAEKILAGIPVLLNTDYRTLSRQQPDIAKYVIYTGCIDEYFDYALGRLSYRSVRFETETLPQRDFQGMAVVNYTAREVPYTRIIEHKHFLSGDRPHTVITREYPVEYAPGMEPYYPVNDRENEALYRQYRELAEGQKNVFFGGRLGQYRYFDMDKVIRAALNAVKNLP